MKKAVLALIVVFVGFWMFTDPSGLAESAKTIGAQGWDVTEQFFQAVIKFFDVLG